jgi:hypothetical protein
MRIRAQIALLIPLACLLGCALPTTPPASTNTPQTGDWINWQIQAGSAITSPPNTYPSFLGAIQIQGTQASGIFTSVVAAGTTGQPLDYTGTFDSSTENVNLATFGYGFDYTQPTTPYTLVPVGVIGGCVYPPTYTGPECLAIAAIPSVGVQIAPLNGTYSGTLTGTITQGTSTSITGTATLTLTQLSTPTSSGKFPLTGTVTFPGGAGGSNLGPFPLAGFTAGEGFNLSYCSPALIGPCVYLTASTDPTASQITVTNLALSDVGDSTSIILTGTLTLQ